MSATRESVENSGEPDVMIISSIGPVYCAAGDRAGMTKRKTSPKITISKIVAKISCNFRDIAVMSIEHDTLHYIYLSNKITVLKRE